MGWGWDWSLGPAAPLAAPLAAALAAPLAGWAFDAWLMGSSGLLQPGHHGSTYAGNPVAAAAGLAVIGVIERDGLLRRASELGDALASRIAALGNPRVQVVRGRGLLRGIVLTSEVAPAVSDALLDAGFIVNAPRPNVIRVAPPLIVGVDHIEAFVETLASVLDHHG